MTTEQITRVAIYARQSAGDEQDSTSIASQLQTLTEIAHTNGWHIVITAQDANASGRTYPHNQRGHELYEMDTEAQEYLRAK